MMELFSVFQKVYHDHTGKNLPIYGVDADSLEQYETTKRDLKQNNPSKIPTPAKRLHELDKYTESQSLEHLQMMQSGVLSAKTGNASQFGDSSSLGYPSDVGPAMLESDEEIDDWIKNIPDSRRGSVYS